MWERDRETYTERETSGVKDDWTIWRIELPSSKMEKTEGRVGPYWEEILSADTGWRQPIDIWQEGQLHGWIWIWSSGERSMQEIPNWQASRQSCCLKPQRCMRTWRMGTWGPKEVGESGWIRKGAWEGGSVMYQSGAKWGQWEEWCMPRRCMHALLNVVMTSTRWGWGVYHTVYTHTMLCVGTETGMYHEDTRQGLIRSLVFIREWYDQNCFRNHLLEGWHLEAYTPWW